MIVRKLSGVISCFKPSKIVDEGKATVSAGQAGNAAARGSALDGLPPRSRLPSAVPRNPAAQVAAPITDKQENAKRHVRLRAPLPNKSPFAVQKAGNEKNVSPPNESALSAFPRAGGSSANPFKALSNAGEKPCLRNFDDADVKWLIASLDKVKVPSEQKARIEEHLRTLSGKTQRKEVALLDHVLQTPNADRALGTYDHMLSMSKASPRALRRLPPEIREELVRGVADPSTGSIKGLKGVLGQRHAQEAARALIEMPEADYDRLIETLSRAAVAPQGKDAQKASGNHNAAEAADTADAHTEKALILKAVGARADRLKIGALDVEPNRKDVSSMAPPRRAMNEIMGFADEIRGVGRKTLILNTTALDIVDGVQCANPVYGYGNYQRYANACGPAVAQNVLAERDPIFAMTVRKEFYRVDEGSLVVRQQKEAVERPSFVNEHGQARDVLTAEEMREWARAGTPPPGFQVERGAVSSLGNIVEMGMLPELKKALTPERYEAVRKYMTNERLTQDEEIQALEIVKRMSGNNYASLTRHVPAGGVTMEMLISEIRSNYVQNEDGTSTKKNGTSSLTSALADIAPLGGSKTWQNLPTNAGMGGLSAEDIARLENSLLRGCAVPVGLANIVCDSAGKITRTGGHGMLMSDVRGEGESRKYLVSDPSSGKTAWVPRTDVLDHDSKWPEKYFDHDGGIIVSDLMLEE